MSEDDAPELTGPLVRPRRLRRTPGLRRMVAETHVDPGQLVLPLFVREGISEPVPIASMPGIVQHTRDTLLKAVAEAADLGLGGVMLYGIPEHKDAVGSGAIDPAGILNLAITDVVGAVGDALTVMSDLCLDEFTDHGHCGVLTPDGRVDNDRTLAVYAEMAEAQADAGVDMVGPSGMMDGQVRAIRNALDDNGHTDVSILAYSAKYASAFFGPFREAVASSLEGDRRTYQQDAGNALEGVREALLDVEQGADIVMVKPALGYLDVVRRVRDAVDVPVAAYNVSGEYAMVEAAAAQGWIDREPAILETLTSIRRAGADIVLTYWAAEAARLLPLADRIRPRGHGDARCARGLRRRHGHRGRSRARSLRSQVAALASGGLQSSTPLLDQADQVALAVADEGLPLVGAGRAEGVVGVAEDHVRLVLDASRRSRAAARSWRRCRRRRGRASRRAR